MNSYNYKRRRRRRKSIYKRIFFLVVILGFLVFLSIFFTKNINSKVVSIVNHIAGVPEESQAKEGNNTQSKVIDSKADIQESVVDDELAMDDEPKTSSEDVDGLLDKVGSESTSESSDVAKADGSAMDDNVIDSDGKNIGDILNKKYLSMVSTLSKEAGIIIETEEGRAYMPGTSHNINAAQYAYDTKTIRKYILNPSSIDLNHKVVFLTFDDGPDVTRTPKVLDILKKHGVHATFMEVGKSLGQKGASDIVKRQLAEGHSLAVHSYNHDYGKLYPHGVCNSSEILSQIKKTEAKYQEVLGLPNFKSTVYRYPGGHMSWRGTKDADKAMTDYGIEWIDWNVISGDADLKSDPRYHEGALEHIKNDLAFTTDKVVVILMHDVHDKSINELENMIEYFKGKGYRFGVFN